MAPRGGVTEIGEGILTVLAQVAAQEIGIRPQDVTIGEWHLQSGSVEVNLDDVPLPAAVDSLQFA